MMKSNGASQKAVQEAAASLVLCHGLASQLSKGPMRLPVHPSNPFEAKEYEVLLATNAGLSVAELEEMCLQDSRKQRWSAPGPELPGAPEDAPAHAAALPLPAAAYAGGMDLAHQQSRYFLMSRKAGQQGPASVACMAGIGFNVSSELESGEDGAPDTVRVNLALVFDYVYTFTAHRRQGAASSLFLTLYEAYLQELTSLAAQLQPAFNATGVPAKLNCTVFADLRSRSAGAAYQTILQMVRDANTLFKVSQVDEPLLQSLRIEALEDASDFVPLAG